MPAPVAAAGQATLVRGNDSGTAKNSGRVDVDLGAANASDTGGKPKQTTACDQVATQADGKGSLATTQIGTDVASLEGATGDRMRAQ